MSNPFVQFPGTSGNYVFTDDVNLLDADTAHIVQAQPWSSAYLSIVNDGVQADGFGQLTGTVQTGGTNARFKVGSLSIGSAPGNYTLLLTLNNREATDRDFALYIFDDVGLKVATQTVSPGEHLISSTLSMLGTTISDIWIESQGTTNVTNDEFSISKIMLASGTVSTFSPSLRIVGDLDLRAKAAADDWTSGNRALMSNYNGDGFLLYHDGSGYLHFESGGATSAIDESSSLYTFVDGQTAEVRVTLDVSAGNIVWYESGVQVDTDTFTAQALDPGSNQLSVAADYLGTGLLFAGDIYYCEVRDGIAGPVVARFDAADVLAAL